MARKISLITLILAASFIGSGCASQSPDARVALSRPGYVIAADYHGGTGSKHTRYLASSGGEENDVGPAKNAIIRIRHTSDPGSSGGIGGVVAGRVHVNTGGASGSGAPVPGVELGGTLDLDDHWSEAWLRGGLGEEGS